MSKVKFVILPFVFGIPTILILLPPLFIAVVSLFGVTQTVWRDSQIRSGAIFGVLIGCWVVIVYWIWHQRYWSNSVLRWVLTLFTTVLPWCGNYVNVQFFPALNRDQKLVELSITKESYANLSLEKQIEVYIEVAHYPSHSNVDLWWMAETIGDKGDESITPIVWTIRAYLYRAKEGDGVAQRIISGLPDVFESKPLSGKIKGSKAEPLLIELACDYEVYNFYFAKTTSRKILMGIYPEVTPRLFDEDDLWYQGACPVLKKLPK